MDINIHIDADERLCRALDNFANTLLSLVIVTEEKRQAEEAKAVETKAEEKAVETKTVETKTEAVETDPAPAPTAIDYKALRAELKSVMAKAAKNGNAESVKALLAELGVSKLSQIPDDVLEEALQKAGDF